MKEKLMKRAYIFAILALIAGVFYREFTKFQGFSGRTSLGFMHTHLLMMGTFFMMGVVLFIEVFKLTEDSKFNMYFDIYSFGLSFMIVMMLVRGITQVMGMDLSRVIDSSISGIAGLSHIIMGVSFILILKKIKDHLVVRNQ